MRLGRASATLLLLVSAGFMIQTSWAGRNLVFNNSFEDINVDLDTIYNFNGLHYPQNVDHWYGFSTDLFGVGPHLLTPITPRDGKYYAGFISLHNYPIDGSTPGYREFIFGELKERLKAGVYYKTSAYFASGSVFPESNLAVPQIGYGFTDTSVVQPTNLSQYWGPATPVQVAAINSSTTPLTSTQWVEVSNPMYLATGSEKKITIGWMNTANPLPVNLVTPLNSTANNEAGAYYYVDNLNVSCETTPSYKLNGNFGDTHVLECGETLQVQNTQSTLNIFGEQWIVQALDENMNPIENMLFTSEITEHSPALQNSNTNIVNFDEVFPKLNDLVARGYHLRLTRSSYCHYSDETSTYTSTIINKNHPTWIETTPEHKSLPALVHVNNDIRFELKHKKEKPIDILWNFDHREAESNGFGTSRNWNLPGLYQNKAIATYDDGCVIKVPIPVRALRETVFIPNSFTPNNDGLNDIFRPATQDVEVVNFIIFNRWGSLVQSSNGRTAGWDGNTSNGEPAPDGVYVYRIEVKWVTDTREGGYTDVKEGTVSLLR